MRFGGTAEFGAFLWTKVGNKPPYCRYRSSCPRRDEARRLVVDGAALITGKMTAKVSVADRIVHNRYLAAWVREHGGWKFVAYQLTPIIDGCHLSPLRSAPPRRYSGEADKIGQASPIAKQAFVGRPLSDLWLQRLSGFPLRKLSVRDLLCAGDDVLLARAAALSFCSRRARLLRHQIVTVVLGRYRP